MRHLLRIALACAVLATPAAAANRLLPDGVSGTDVNLAREFAEGGGDLELGGGLCWRGRLSATLALVSSDAPSRDGLRGDLALALLRRGGLGVELGYGRFWRGHGRADRRLVPLRVFRRLGLAGPLTLVPHATVTKVLGQDHDDELGELGLDLVWRRRLRLGLEWNLNEDLRYHPLTVRVGLIRTR
ncbi:MAG: hypothetical protein R3D98_11035 [Candidatus Krumholzibacteriia bacterium]